MFFLLRPTPTGDETERLISEAERVIRATGHETRVLGTSHARLDFEQFERRDTQLVEPNDAHRIYAQVHQSEVAVLTFDEAYVRRDPRRKPRDRADAIPLEVFVQHKALFFRIRRIKEVAAAVKAYEAERTAPAGCSGFDDPRVLPLHVFAVTGDWSGLGEPNVDAKFQFAYGKPGLRRDAKKRVWARASALHGRDILVVARRDLPAGAHWDVTTDGKKGTLLASNQVWKLGAGLKDYLNAYPNEYIRKTSASRCKLVFPRP